MHACTQAAQLAEGTGTHACKHARTRVQALKLAEAVAGSERHPRLVPLLLLLATAYSRSARVTYAEGLYREAAKLAGLDPARDPPGAGQQPQQAGQHATLEAALAWSYCQLLYALPNRWVVGCGERLPNRWAVGCGFGGLLPGCVNNCIFSLLSWPLENRVNF